MTGCVINMKYYLITSKSDDYGRYGISVFAGEESLIMDHVYWYKEIPKTHYQVLKKYVEDINDIYYEDFGYDTLGDYLEEYF